MEDLSALGQEIARHAELLGNRHDALVEAAKLQVNLSRAPAWAKVAEKVDGDWRIEMLEPSDIYAILFLKPPDVPVPSDPAEARASIEVWKDVYRGGDDVSVWGPETGEKYRQNDLDAIARGGRPVFTQEHVPHVPVINGGHGDGLYWPIVKVSAQVGDSLLVIGRAYPPTPEISWRVHRLFLDLNYREDA